MAASDADKGYMPSIIDRLTDPTSAGTGGRQGYTFEQMRDAVRRDLENLLNTRPVLTDIPEASALSESVVAYGLPDLTSLMAVTEAQRKEIGVMIERTIRRFEPRLRDVRVTLQVVPKGNQNQVQFHIHGRLQAEETAEVAFHTDPALTIGSYSLKAT